MAQQGLADVGGSRGKSANGALPRHREPERVAMTQRDQTLADPHTRAAHPDALNRTPDGPARTTFHAIDIELV